MKNPTQVLGKRTKLAPQTLMMPRPRRFACRADCRAPSVSLAPNRCPTSAVAAFAKPRPGRNESDSMFRPTWCAAYAATPK